MVMPPRVRRTKRFAEQNLAGGGIHFRRGKRSRGPRGRSARGEPCRACRRYRRRRASTWTKTEGSPGCSEPAWSCRRVCGVPSVLRSKTLPEAEFISAEEKEAGAPAGEVPVGSHAGPAEGTGGGEHRRGRERKDHRAVLSGKTWAGMPRVSEASRFFDSNSGLVGT